MQITKLFHEADRSVLVARIEAHPLAVIIAADETGGVVTTHAPVFVEEREGEVFLRFHLARNNPAVAALLQSQKSLCVFTGPNAYISPDWYEAADQAPTWNYLTAECEGPVRELEAGELVGLLDELSEVFERGLSPKPMWTRDKMRPGLFDAMLQAIVGFELTAARFEGTTKLNQNKNAEVRKKVAAELGDHPISEAMRKLDD